jgi:hypothetical protein
MRGRRGTNEPWSVSIENARGTIVIESQPGPPAESRTLLDDFNCVVWNHSAVAQAVPLFPQHPQWGWITVGPHGRYEFKSLGNRRTDDAGARVLLERTLKP